MGANLCSLLHPKPKSAEPSGRSSSSFITCFIKPKCSMRSEKPGRRRRKKECTETYKTQNLKINAQMEKKRIKARKFTLEDWLLASPADSKPEYLKRDEICSFKSSKKKVHPSSSSSSTVSQVHRSLISEAKDSLCLDRPMNDRKKEEEEEGKSECLSSVSIGKAEKKKVSFKLPHDVILYSPEEEAYGNDGNDNNSSSEDSFYSPMEGNCRGGSFESPEELCFNPAVNTLPHV